MERNKPCFCGSGFKQKRCHSDIEENSMFADLIKFYNEVDYRLKNTVNPMHCHHGCCECCYQIFDISNLEFAYMCYGYMKTNSLDKLFDYGESIYQLIKANNPVVLDLLKKQEKASTLKEFTDLSLNMFYAVCTLKYPCPFLNTRDGSCFVYDYRPFICRKHGVAYVDNNELPPRFKPCSKDSSFVKTEELLYVGDLASNNMVLSVFEDQISGAAIIDKMFPIFYFCHLGFKGLDDYVQKITTFSNYSRKRYTDILKCKTPLAERFLTRKK